MTILDSLESLVMYAQERGDVSDRGEKLVWC